MDANTLAVSNPCCSLLSFFHITQLLPGSDPRDSPTRFCWPNTNYNNTSWVINYFVAPAFFWLCNHRLVTLQSRTCDFVIAGSVLQSWFKPNFSNTSFLLSFPFRSSFAILAASVQVLLPLVAKPSENSLGEGKKSSWSQWSGSQKESATSSGNFSSHFPACLRSVCKPAAFKDGTLPTPFWARAWAIENPY
jgi:hypothetical protein